MTAPLRRKSLRKTVFDEGRQLKLELSNDKLSTRDG
jgi:hypothetical protein